MPQLIAPTGRVHWIGAGLSTGSGLRVLCDGGAELAVWSRSAGQTARLLARLGIAERATAPTYDPARLADALAPGDVLVSMLPAPEHAALLLACLAAGAHFACSSYVSPAMLGAAPEMARAGLALLAEAGLDPGIDHLMAHVLVGRARAAVGDGDAAAAFTSYCGGVPAVPNDFRYRFSWAPAGVLSALRAPARYIEGGVERTADRPWTATRPESAGGEVFEAYPNRDSLPFVTQYGLPPSWRIERFVRGTLRLAGWRQAWAPVFEELERADEARIAALARDLAARYPTSEVDRDRVVLQVALDVRGAAGRSFRGEYLLDLVGEPAESAMARCVSVPLAIGVRDILDGAVSPGLHRAADDAAASERLLAALARHGVSCTLRPERALAPAADRSARRADLGEGRPS